MKRDSDQDTEKPDFHLGNDGRPTGMPTPPGAGVVNSKPVTTPDSKRVLLRAERNDEVEIQQVVHGMTNVPKHLTVVQRAETYFGPCLTLHAEVDGDDQNYQLTCPGPNSQLILWKSNTGMDGKWRDGWVPVSEVKAAISDMEQYKMCEVCGRPLRGMWHERLRAVGACEDLDDSEVNAEI